MTRRLFVLVLLVLLAAPLFGEGQTEESAAERFPERPVTLVIPWDTGSMSFLMGQMFAEFLSDYFGQRFLVEAKPGGTGSTGARFVANSEPDGYTILQAWIAPMVLVPLRGQDVGYDPIEDFDHLGYGTQNPVVVYAHVDAPYDTLREFVEHVEDNPNQTFSYGSGGALAIHTIYAEETFAESGVEVEAVLYQGSSAALPDLLSRNLDVVFSTPTAIVQYDDVKPIAIYADERIRQQGLGSIPTAKELGFDTPVAVAWAGWAAPAGLPDAVRQKLVDAFEALFTDEEMTARIRDRLNLFPTYKNPEEFRAIIERDLNDLSGPIQRALERQQ